MTSFPHQNTFNAIRDALWSPTTAGASVLVGSGFSRNADKARPDASEMPRWSDLAASMHAALYPPEDGDRRSSVDNRTFEPGSILRLAQEYEASYGEDGFIILSGSVYAMTISHQETSIIDYCAYLGEISLPPIGIHFSNGHVHRLLKRATE